METPGSSSDIDKRKKKGKRKINIYFYSVVSGTVLTYSSLVALQTLQTSINIEGNAGSIALTSAYVATMAYSIFLAAAMLKKFGIAFNLILTDICFALYSLSNFYPELYVLVPGAIISAVSRATSLPVTAMATFLLADMFGNLGSEEKTYYINRYQGRFLGLFNSVAIIGNCVSFAILYAGGGDSSKNDKLPTSATALPFETTLAEKSNYSQYEFCGVNDCQDPDVVSENIDQYVPPNKTSMYILVGVTTVMCLVAIVVHALVYPGVGPFKRDSVTVTDEVSLRESGHANAGYNGKEEIDASDLPDISSKRSVSDAGSTELDNKIDEKEQGESYMTTLKKTGKFLIKFEAVLLSFTAMRSGMIIGIVLSDMTRAYASCVAGVEVTSIIAMTFGAVGIPASLAYAWGVKYIGRNVIMAVAFLIEMSVYVGCYVWVPNPDTIVYVYLIFIGFGIVSGVLRPLVTTTYDAYFPEDKHIAVNVWNFWMQAGVGLQYGLSTTMCMVDKIYLTSAFTIFSMIAYVWLEVLQRRKSAKNSPDEMSEEVPTTEL